MYVMCKNDKNTRNVKILFNGQNEIRKKEKKKRKNKTFHFMKKREKKIRRNKIWNQKKM